GGFAGGGGGGAAGGRAGGALGGVPTVFFPASAAEIAALAGSPPPPINSTKTSISRSVASVTGSATQRNFLRPMSRFLLRERAVTATTSIGRPQRAASASRWRSMRRGAHAPTVPRPAIPSFSGADIVGLRGNGASSAAGPGGRRCATFLGRVQRSGGRCARLDGYAARFRPARGGRILCHFARTR